MSEFRSKRWAPILLIALLFAGAAASFYLRRPVHRDGSLDIDEAQWLSMSIQNVQQLRGLAPPSGDPNVRTDGDEANPWATGIHTSTFGFAYPMLAKLVLGAALVTTGHTDYDRNVFPRFVEGMPRTAARALRSRGERAVLPGLWVGRWVVICVGASIAVLLFLIGIRLAGWVGASAYLLWILHPLVVNAATRVRTDLFPILFMLAALLFALHARMSLSGRRGVARMLFSAAGLAVLCGLSVSTKLNGALSCLMIGAWIPGLWWSARRGGTVSLWKGPVPAVLTAAMVCVGVFFLFNPAIWPDPVEMTSRILEVWDEDIHQQQEKWKDMRETARTIPEHFGLAFSRIIRRDEPLQALTGMGGGVVLLLGGLAVLVVRVLRRRSESAARAMSREHALVILVLVVFVGVGYTLWLPFDRRSFFLPYVPPMVILEAVLLSAAASLGGGLYLARRSLPPT